MRGLRGTYARLNQMVDAAIDGSFEEEEFNETELSKLEAKWKRFLVDAQLSREQLRQERASLQGLVSDISHQLKTPLANLLLPSSSCWKSRSWMREAGRWRRRWSASAGSWSS